MANTKTTKAAFPAKTAPVGAKPKKAVPPTVVAKGKRGFAALAEGVPGLRKAVPATKTPAKPRSGAAKPAAMSAAKQVAKTPAKRTSAIQVAGEAMVKTTKATVLKQAIVPGLPVTEVTSIGQLRAALADFPVSNKFTTDRKFGKDIITVQNMRGRSVAEIHAIPKK